MKSKINIPALLTPLILLFTLTACSLNQEASKKENNSMVAEEHSLSVIATEKTFPTDFMEKGFTRENTPRFTYFLQQVTDQEEFEKTFEYFGFNDAMPFINFETNNAVFFALTESGSCPVELSPEDVHYHPEKERLNIVIAGSDGDCTADATPRTFIIEVPKETNLNREAEIHESNVQTIVPIN